MNRIILLDVDGVLVQPIGYRAALRATVRHFTAPNLEIGEDILVDLEKRGVSSEWDMVPLIIASYWDSILLQQPMQNLPDDVSAAAQEIQRQRRVDGSINIPVFDGVSGQYPAQTAYEAGLFPSIPETLRKYLLTETRNIHKCHSMRVFQHYTLGSEHFKDTYDMRAEFETESYLLKYDVANISVNDRDKLLTYHPVVFSARPSAPPREINGPIFGYAPEAELALELVGLQEIPVIAFGKLEYIASQYNLDPAILVKPSPFHALVCVLAALTGDELSSLHAACDFQATGELKGVFVDLPKSIELIVIEDTMGGIRSACKAGEILCRSGFDVSVRMFGLTNGSTAKAAAFEVANIPHYEKWETLIKQMKL